jgi:hypothetical protein
MQTFESVHVAMRCWRSDGVPLRMGGGAHSGAAFESTHSVVLPDDVQMFFPAMGGKENARDS